jgi:GNAT superfamily N-acetyltransferase
VGAEVCLLEDLFVAVSARGRGLGRELVEATVELARERGCRRSSSTSTRTTPAPSRSTVIRLRPQDDRYGGRNLFARLHLDPR